MEREGQSAGELGWEQLLEVVSGLSEGLFIYSPEGHPLYANRAAHEEKYGYLHPSDGALETSSAVAQPAPPGRGAERLGHPRQGHLDSSFELRTLVGEPLPYAAWPLPRLLRGDAFSELEARVVRRTGGRWVHTLSGWTAPSTHGPLRILSVRDVTRHREAEERFSVCFESSPVATSVARARDLELLSVNGTLVALTGFSRVELVGGRAEALFLLPGAGQRGRTWRLPSGDTVRDTERTLRTKAGEVRHVIVSERPIELDGEACVLYTLVDISERKRTEELLLRALQEVMQDAAWLSAQVMERLAQLRAEEGERTEVTALTRREQQILGLLAKGCSNEQIGAELGLAKQTVRNYVANIYRKLGVHSRAEAVVWARERGFGAL